MNTDPIADLLTRIRNASRAHHETVSVPYSKVKESILKVMKEREFIDGYIVGGEGISKEIEVTLKEELTNITLKRISSPGQRIYTKRADLKPVKSGLGITIVSTPKGVMTNTQAFKKNLGGELICEIY